MLSTKLNAVVLQLGRQQSNTLLPDFFFFSFNVANGVTSLLDGAVEGTESVRVAAIKLNEIAVEQPHGGAKKGKENEGKTLTSNFC